MDTPERMPELEDAEPRRKQSAGESRLQFSGGAKDPVAEQQAYHKSFHQQWVDRNLRSGNIRPGQVPPNETR